jgi:type I restriction enzyme S subunit
MIDGLPKGWAYKKLRFVGRFLSSGIDKKIVDGDPLVKMINYTDIYGNKTLKLDNSREFMEVSCPAPKQKSCQVHYGDLIFTPSSETIEDIGVSALVDEHLTDTVFSYHVLRFTFTEKVYHEFKKYLCNNDWVLSEFSRVAKGTTRQILNRNDFNSIRVILPPFQEQVRIADFLDQKTSEIDELISAKEKLLKLLEEKKVSIITRAVTKGLNQDVKMKYSGVDWIGDIPAHWGVKRLKYVVTLMNEKTGPYDDNLEFVGLENIQSKTGRYLPSDYSAPDRTATKFKKSDVLFGKLRPYLAKVLHTEFSGCCTTEAFVLRSKDSVYSRFVFYYILSDAAIKVINGSTYGVKMPRANWDFIGNLPIVIPPLSEQKHLVSKLDEQISNIDELSSSISDAINVLNEFKNSLITSAVTGRIDFSKLKQEHQDEKTY